MKYYIYAKPVDMRKQFSGLLGIIKSEYKKDPLSGDCYFFVNKRGDYIKAIYWDRTGYCLFSKKLERGRFKVRISSEERELKKSQLSLLLDGIPL
jgi:transposase